jgi:membrane fusion protein (multidrug efflux system)
MMRHNDRIHVLRATCLALTASFTLLAGCSKPAAPVVPPPPTVGVVDSRLMSVPVLAATNGTTRALEEVSIRARVRGFLIERHFEEGSYVKKGDLLLVIDETPYQITLSSAKAKRSEAEAAVTKAEKSKVREVSQSQLALDQAQLTLSQIEERRAKALLARSAGSREDLDKAEADRKKNEAQVESSQANAEQAKADYAVGILASKAQLEAAEAAVREAEVNLGYCRMSSPIDGRIGESKVRVGNLVGPDASSGGGAYSELASIQQLEPMGLDVRVSSRSLARATRLISEGLKIRLTMPGIDGPQDYPHEGVCYFIDNTIDPTTSTFLVKARIPNPERALLPGEYVTIKAVVDRIEDAVVVPETSVMEQEGGPVVYIVDKDGKVAIQKVIAGQTYEGVRVITSGLAEGVPVIVQGLQLIRPGMQVKTEPAVLPRPVGDAPTAVAATARPGAAARAESTSVEGTTGPAVAEVGTAKAEPAVTPGGPRSAVVAPQPAATKPGPDARPEN